jgi:hypothetical protein
VKIYLTKRPGGTAAKNPAAFPPYAGEKLCHKTGPGMLREKSCSISPRQYVSIATVVATGGGLNPRTAPPNSYCWLRLASPAAKQHHRPKPAAAPTIRTTTLNDDDLCPGPHETTATDLHLTLIHPAPAQKASCHPQETVVSHAWERNRFPGDRPPFGSGGFPRARPKPNCGCPRFRGELSRQ